MYNWRQGSLSYFQLGYVKKHTHKNMLSAGTLELFGFSGIPLAFSLVASNWILDQSLHIYFSSHSGESQSNNWSTKLKLTEGVNGKIFSP